MEKEVQVAKIPTRIGDLSIKIEKDEDNDILIYWEDRLIAMVSAKVEKDPCTHPPVVRSVNVSVWPDPHFDYPVSVPVRDVYEEDGGVYAPKAQG